MSHREHITNIKQSVYFTILLPTFCFTADFYTKGQILLLIYTHIDAFVGDITLQMLASHKLEDKYDIKSRQPLDLHRACATQW